MATTDKDTETKPLYTYLPTHLHDWLDEVKSATDISKSDVVNLMLELGKKHCTTEQIQKLHDEFLIFGPEGLGIHQQNKDES